MGVEGAGAHPYRLSRDAMKQSGQVGVARMALRGPERLVVLREQPQARNISAHAEMFRFRCDTGPNLVSPLRARGDGRPV
ncbi:hypothetical protein [Streptomyces sp. NRRL S-1813]|uniref:hypothetical protein n=1 Tax=Streptomyces sp. NRRL S-1813 TaxID=1463888 RepID=UPI003B63F252